MWAHVTLVVLCGLIFTVRAGRLVLRGTGRAPRRTPAAGLGGEGQRPTA